MKLNLSWIVVVIVILLLSGTSQSCAQKSDEEITALAERAAYEKKITFILPGNVPAVVPLEYTASVTQCSVKDACKTRYYNPRPK